MSMTLIGKNGTAKMYKIACAAAHAEDAPYTGFSTDIDGDDLIITTGKRELGAVQQWAESLQSMAAPAKTKTATSKRRIELHSVAVEQDLNCGKAWRATLDNVDRNSLDPSWEGELICYVYS